MADQKSVLFFDGECNLCNGFVDFLMRHDRQRRLYYASLQGETARLRIPEISQPPYSTVILLTPEKRLQESDAALEAIALLGGAWALIRLFSWLPLRLRNAVYQWVAKNRYSFFGKRETCRVPTELEKAYFLP